MEESVNISSTISFRTQIWVAHVVLARSAVGLLFYGVFVGFPILALLTFSMQRGQWTSHSANWIGLLILPAIALLFLPLCTASNIWRARRRNACLRGVLRFALTPEAFQVHGESFDTRLRWDAIQKVVETSGFFLFYVAPTIAHIIPKACAASPTDINNIRTIVREALGPKAKLRVA